MSQSQALIILLLLIFNISLNFISIDVSSHNDNEILKQIIERCK